MVSFKSIINEFCVCLAFLFCFSLAAMGSNSPIIDLSESLFRPVAHEGGLNPDPNTLVISNPGGGILNWTADLTGKPDWLTVNPTSGSLDPNESEVVTLSVDISGLAYGSYLYTFELSDPAAGNSPQAVTVQLSVRTDYLIVPNDLSSIQTAIDCIAENGTIVVLPGTYTENLVLPGRDFILTSTDPEDSNVVASTIIDGNQTGSVITFAGTETSACQLRGFTITNGYASGSIPYCLGGGIHGSGTHAGVFDCVVTGNTVSYSGGGLDDCDGSITNCVIMSNTAAAGVGGGLRQCDGAIRNCIISGNTAAWWGGGLDQCGGSITNCTIASNTAADSCGGGLCDCTGPINNCIIWGNSAVSSGVQLCNSSTPTFSCIQDWTGGGAGNIPSDPNIVIDPMFVDTSSANPTEWDLHLLPGSPCIDAGTNTPPGGLPTTDIEGTPRPLDGDLDGTATADMGAYEVFLSDDAPYLVVWPKSSNFTAYEDGLSPAAQTETIKNYENQTLNWSLDLTGKPDWLTVLPTNGSLIYDESDSVTLSVDTTGLSGGQYSYSFEVNDPAADNSPQSVTVNLDVIGPILEVSSNAFDFTAFEEDPNSNPKTLIISNSGGDTVNWSLDLTGKPDWLTVSQTSGSLAYNESEPVTLSVDVIGLPAGLYSYSFEVSDPAADNSPQSVTVNLDVIGPILNISSNAFDFTAFEEDPNSNPDSKTLIISNDGGATVNWSVADANEVTFTPPEWLTVNLTSGSLAYGESDNVTLAVDTTGLSGGQYSYSFEVSDPAADNSPQLVTVNLDVIGPILNISSNVFNFTVFTGDSNPDPRTLVISNTGGGTVNWSADLTGKPDWLLISSASGSLDPNESDNVTLSVGISGLPGGQYSYSFQVSDPAAANSPQSVMVQLGIFTDCLVVPNDYSTIQAAIDNVAANGTIVVRPGRYVENLICPGKDFILTSEDPLDPNVVEATIIDGNRNGSVIIFSGNETSACQLRGFTITRGFSYDDGGGIVGNHTDAGISYCTIVDNYTRSIKGGGGLVSCDGIISRCNISDNFAETTDGGGLAYCDGLIINCNISGNTAVEGSGGGLCWCDGLIVNCIISNNSAPGYFVVCNNECLGGHGGAAYGCYGIFANCTIVNNSVESKYGYDDCGGANGLDSCGIIINCIVWSNTGKYISYQILKSTPMYSCIQDWTGGGTGNITSDPLFIDADNGDYHLKSEYGRWDPAVNQWVYDSVTSPCIDAGDPEVVRYWDPNGTSADPNDDYLVEIVSWQNELWPHGGRINMGAYGGTPAASMSGYPIGNMADLDHDDVVGILDVDRFSNDWLVHEYLLDTDLNLDGRVDIEDFALFAGEWLWEQGAILDIDINAFDFSAFESGANPAPNILTITNTGVESVNWSISDANEVTFSPPDWLMVSPISGSLTHDESDSVTLSVDISGLSGGQYSYSFEVSDPAADNSPQTVTVDLEVVGLPTEAAYWAFDESAGTAASDSSGNGHDGTLMNMEDPNWVSGKIGNCLSFDGTDAYVEVSYHSNLNPVNFSVAFWAKVDGNSDTYRTPVCSRDYGDTLGLGYDVGTGYNVYASADNTWQFWTGRGDSSGSFDSIEGASVEVGVWTHIAATFEALSGPDANGSYTGTQKLYVNGVLEATGTDRKYAVNITESVTLGRINHSGLWYFNGDLDEVRIYDQALSAAQIQALLNE